jgi:hypothetical protein
MASLRIFIALLCLLLPTCSTTEFSNTHLIEYHGDRLAPQTPLRGTGMLPKKGTYNPIQP